VLDTLRKEGLAKNTLVFVNERQRPLACERPRGWLRGAFVGGKGSTWEGGMREPVIAWWPGKIKAGVVNREMACSMDLFPTYATLAKVPILRIASLMAWT